MTMAEFSTRAAPMGRSRRGSGLPMPMPGINLGSKSRSSGGCRMNLSAGHADWRTGNVPA
jgi:hypothetical protein